LFLGLPGFNKFVSSQSRLIFKGKGFTPEIVKQDNFLLVSALKNNESELVLPVSVNLPWNVDLMKQFDSIVLGIVGNDSTTSYYRIKSGLVPPMP